MENHSIWLFVHFHLLAPRKEGVGEEERGFGGITKVQREGREGRRLQINSPFFFLLSFRCWSVGNENEARESWRRRERWRKEKKDISARRRRGRRGWGEKRGK